METSNSFLTSGSCFLSQNSVFQDFSILGICFYAFTDLNKLGNSTGSQTYLGDAFFPQSLFFWISLKLLDSPGPFLPSSSDHKDNLSWILGAYVPLQDCISASDGSTCLGQEGKKKSKEMIDFQSPELFSSQGGASFLCSLARKVEFLIEILLFCIYCVVLQYGLPGHSQVKNQEIKKNSWTLTCSGLKFLFFSPFSYCLLFSLKLFVFSSEMLAAIHETDVNKCLLNEKLSLVSSTGISAS